MIKFEYTDVHGFAAAIRGMRNPKQSWDSSDSYICNHDCDPDFPCDVCGNKGKGNDYVIGPDDHKLAMKLAKAGPDHGKLLRFINVSVDIIAPAFWWHEMDQYRVATVTNSTSLQHTGAERDFTPEDFSCEDVKNFGLGDNFRNLLQVINSTRKQYVKSKDYSVFRALRQLMPMSFNYRKTWGANYAVLRTIYHQRKNHKLSEWREFCSWIESLPYSELITEV